MTPTAVGRRLRLALVDSRGGRRVNPDLVQVTGVVPGWAAPSALHSVDVSPQRDDSPLRRGTGRVQQQRDAPRDGNPHRQHRPAPIPGRTWAPNDSCSRRCPSPNGGPNQTPDVMVMRINDTVGPTVDRALKGLVVVFNASDEAAPPTQIPNRTVHRLRPHGRCLCTAVSVSSRCLAPPGTGYTSQQIRQSPHEMEPA